MYINTQSQKLRDFYENSSWKNSVLEFYPYKNEAEILFDPSPENLTVSGLKKLLEHHCRVVIIYSNPFGLSKWAGLPAYGDVLPYTSIDGHNKDFPSKAELTSRINAAGFCGQKWYYPLSNHYFAEVVYSENYLPHDAIFDHRPRYALFNSPFLKFRYDCSPDVYNEIIKNNVFEFFTESFFVEILPEGFSPCEVDFATITSYRIPESRFATLICADKVYKKPLTPESQARLKQTAQNHKDLAELGIDVLPLEFDEEKSCLVSKRINLPVLWDFFEEKFTAGELTYDMVSEIFKVIKDDILTASKNGRIYYDMVPANIFYDEKNKKLLYFDQEYSAPIGEITHEVALTRAIKSFYWSTAFSGSDFIERLCEEFNISDKYQIYGDIIVNVIDKEIGFYNREDGVIDFFRDYQNTISENRIKALNEAALSANILLYGFGVRGKKLNETLKNRPVIVDIKAPEADFKSLDDIPEEILNGIDFAIITPAAGQEEIKKMFEEKNIQTFTYHEFFWRRKYVDLP